jgi:L-lactate dehydrogenase complex protein LldG
MSSREKILQAVKNNQPAFQSLPELPSAGLPVPDSASDFTTILEAIGGNVFRVTSYREIEEHIRNVFPTAKRIISTSAELSSFAKDKIRPAAPHDFHDVDLAVISSGLGVAENGSIWITEDQLPERVLPFICEHLAVVLEASAIVPTMHHAYEKIADKKYGYGVFIAGPSKTADIEQSLVLGAHGPKSMTVFLLSA